MLSYQDKLIDIILKINNNIKNKFFEIKDNNIIFKMDEYLKNVNKIFEEKTELGINDIIIKKILKQYYLDKNPKLKNIQNYKFKSKSEIDVFLELYINKVLNYKELLSIIYPYYYQDNFFNYIYQNKNYFTKIYLLLFFVIVVYYLII